MGQSLNRKRCTDLRSRFAKLVCITSFCNVCITSICDVRITNI